ncbi:hypothetical protein DERF_005598 [Dermatophagoides farinae]|uniref:Uncharacterized protein n=1 Tax=Dermatophagoides farinae TaxID=6954 RepID=A0A922L6R8_DERFA|nr:hypothetical protein DERF_005598 [Dermatophagoides farinae]
MSTSSPPSSSIHNNNNDDDDDDDQPNSSSPIIGMMSKLQKNSPTSNSSIKSYQSDVQQQQQQQQLKNNGLSPRIPRKQIPMTNNNEMDIDDQKQIISSPSIIITASPQSGIQNSMNGSSQQQQQQQHQHLNRNPQQLSTDDLNGYLDFDDDDCSPRTRMIPKDSGANWIQMDDYHYQQKYKGKNIINDDQQKQQQQQQQHGKTDNDRIDVSLYTTKKNVAQGMLVIALLSANCSQLKYLLYHYERDVPIASSSVSSIPSSGNRGDTNTWATIFHTNTNTGSLDFYFTTNLACICISIFLQIIIGILLILNSRHNVYIHHRYQRVADSYSNWILLAVFIVTVVNIFLSVFISAR